MHSLTPLRRGISTLWLLIWLPAVIVLLGMLLGVANLWLARVEMETALEAAALAAVQKWGETSGTGTLQGRQAGVAYAAANQVRGDPVLLDTNHNSAAPVSSTQNLVYTLSPSATSPKGSLIFGAIDESDPLFPETFNAGLLPACGAGRVLFDATDNGGVGGPGAKLEKENAWGISFQQTNPPPPAGLRIDWIEIDLRGGGGSGTFVGLPVLDVADPSSSWAMRDSGGALQADIFGFAAPATQITFTNLGSGKLRIDFSASGGDLGFEPGDRIRFGHDVDNVSSGLGTNGGDGIGRDRVTVTVQFSVLGVPITPPSTATFVDTQLGSNDCLNTAVIDPITGTYAVQPPPATSAIPDLPCPPTSAANNNGQSWVLLGAGSQTRFAVRAQAKMEVRPLGSFLLSNATSYCVQASATAVYDCQTGRAVLFRPDRYLGP